MKIAIHSDLHLEGFRIPDSFLTDDSYDVLVLAGDIVSARTIDRLILIRQLVDFSKPIIFVPGNHEYYGGDVATTSMEIMQWCEENRIIYADRKEITIDNVKFICATGWATLGSYDQYSLQEKVDRVNACINDVRVVAGFTVEHMMREGQLDRLFIDRQLHKHSSKYTCVVVTHFAPTENHNSKLFNVSPLSSYFANDYSAAIAAYKPAVWVYGHTHDNVSSDNGKTRVVSNQRGYGTECESTYNPNFIIEV